MRNDPSRYQGHADDAAPHPHPFVSIDPAWLSETIGEIYDCAIDPTRWQETLAKICDRLSFYSGALGILSLRPKVDPISVHYRIDDERLATLDSYRSDSIEIWGGPERLQSYPLEEPFTISEIRPPSEWSRFAYFREILEPRGIIDGVSIALARTPELIGYLGLDRHASNGPVREEDVEPLRLLAPHLRRAVTIGDLFDLKAVEATTFRSVIDGMSAGVVLVDDTLGIVRTNPVADAMLASGDVIQRTQGRLTARGDVADGALRAAVRSAATNETGIGRRGIGIPAAARDGSPAVMHVLPLARGELRAGLVQRAVAAIFVVPGTTPHAPIDAIATLYDLTPAEGQILASIGRGTSVDDTAEALGIARSTARTHLLRVFAKTGCSRQAELVALVARLSISL